jgi:hypothetical protein
MCLDTLGLFKMGGQRTEKIENKKTALLDMYIDYKEPRGSLLKSPSYHNYVDY